MLRNLGFLGRGWREGRPCGVCGPKKPPHPAAPPSRREDESEGSREGPPGSPPPRGRELWGGGGRGQAASVGRGLYGSRVTGPPFPGRGALGPAGAPPPPFRPLRGNSLPAQVLFFEALNEAFQKFLKLPRPAQHSRGHTLPHPSTPAPAAGLRGCGKGAEGAGPKPPESKHQPGAAGSA